MEQKQIVQRNYGIDLLRIVSMFLVVLLHSLGHGGALSAMTPGSAHYAAGWLLECFAYCAVNCFALVSGYVGLTSRFKLSNIVTLWLQVLFYHAAFTFLDLWITGQPVTAEIILTALTPLKSKAYWYYTAYFAISFFIPLVNTALEHMDRQQARPVLWGIIVLFSVYPTLTGKDLFKLDGGYHALWLLVIYIIGACIRKYRPLEAWGKRAWAMVYLSSVFLSWGMLMLSNRMEIKLVNLIQYTSPTILLSAAALLCLFARLRPPVWAQKLIARLSPLTFGIYLIHDSIFVRKNLIRGTLAAVSQRSVPGMLAVVVGFAAAVFVICMLIDHIRSLIFKALRIRQAVEYLEKKLIR